MRKKVQKFMAILLAGIMAVSMAACTPNEAENAEQTETTESAETTEKEDEEVVLKITWWGGQGRHDYTQELLDLYTELNPHVTFEAIPSGWDGYFDKLSTQAASGAMPDIVQMDYLYISTYAKNNSVADLQPFIADGTIETSNIDENLLKTGNIDGKMAGLVLSSSLLAIGYNPAVLEEAGMAEPDSSWTWSDFIKINETITEETGKYGAPTGTVTDTNLFNYWVRQHGAALFSEDNLSLGYEDDKIFTDYITMWKDLMDKNVVPNPDEWAQIETLGQEASPIVTGDGGMMVEWNNYAAKLSGVNDSLKVVSPPLSDNSDDKGLWMKPGMFFAVAETSNVKKEAAEFINWFVNSEEANDIIVGERGTPSSAAIRGHLVASGMLNEKQQEMFNFVDDAASLCGETPAPDPIGMAELNDVFKNMVNAAYYGQLSPEEAAANFRAEANEILERNN